MDDIVSDEYLDIEDILKINKLAKDVRVYEESPVHTMAQVSEIMMDSEKNRRRHKAIMKEVLNEYFDTEKFRWSQDSKMIDWGQYVFLPKWMRISIKPFPVAWFQISVVAMLVLILLRGCA